MTTGAINRAKLQSNYHLQQTNIQFLQVGRPSCHPSNNVKALKGIKTQFFITCTCIMWEVEDYEDAGKRPGVKNDMESLGVSENNAQFRNKWRTRIKGQLADSGSPGKMAVKMECVCVCVCSVIHVS